VTYGECSLRRSNLSTHSDGFQKKAVLPDLVALARPTPALVQRK